VRYPAVVDKDPDSDCGATFPDFPGCVSAGKTLDEAVLGAHEALAVHVALMVADGDTLPGPTPLEVVAAQRDASTVAITLVPVTLPGKARHYRRSNLLNLIRCGSTAASPRRRFLSSS
jgi:predicted RNase H-like HicB family nuclease